MTVAAASTVPADELRRFVAALFAAGGVNGRDAERTAFCLVEADLCGVPSHGIGRVPIYLERLRRGLLNPAPALRVTEATPAAAHLDGDNGLGFVVATAAMDEAIERAGRTGIAMVAASRSNHFGMAASYIRQAVKEGFAAFVFTNASPAMPVWGGRKPFLGTSPFAFGAPGAPGGPDIVLDMATSVVARGKIRRAMQAGEPIPDGWALDADGRPTNDAAKAYEGVVLPLGGPKGSGLSLMMEILAGVMSGSAFGGQVGHQYVDFAAPQNAGHMFIAFRPDLFLPPDAYGARVGDLVGRAKASPPVEPDGEILMPGERGARLAAAREREGVPVARADLVLLSEEAERAGVAVPAGLRPQ